VSPAASCKNRAVKWPAGFLWGTAASSTQCEGAAEASDWWAWERAGRAPLSLSGNGFAVRYREDFALLKSLGLTHHRMSIEWARIEPSRGRRDPEAIEHYLRVLSAARQAGIEPWICLHHFTLPDWFAEDGGFLEPTNRKGAWAGHVGFMAETFGDLAAGWQPVNETNYYARAAYGGRGWPPGTKDPETVAVVEENIQLASAEAAVRLRQTGLPVASIFGLSPIVAQDDDPATMETVEKLFDIYWQPGLGLFRDGVLRVRHREPIERPDLAGSFDLLGFSYYSGMGVKGGRLAVQPPDARVSPLGYGIWPDGVGLVLDRLHDELPGSPLLVAEFGIGTDDDNERTSYLEQGIAEVHAAIGRGIDVRGFFHWTAVDNYEWLHGYDVPFGIIDRERQVRPSAEVLAREARRGC
jgi:beta-glucosidase